MTFDRDDMKRLMVDYCRERLSTVGSLAGGVELEVLQPRMDKLMFAEIHKRRVGDYVQRCSSLNHWLAGGNFMTEEETARMGAQETRLRADLARFQGEQFAVELLGLLAESKRANVFLFGLAGLSF